MDVDSFRAVDFAGMGGYPSTSLWGLKRLVVAILSIKDQIELTLFARTVDFRLNLLSKMHKVAI